MKEESVKNEKINEKIRNSFNGHITYVTYGVDKNYIVCIKYSIYRHYSEHSKCTISSCCSFVHS